MDEIICFSSNDERALVSDETTAQIVDVRTLRAVTGRIELPEENAPCAMSPDGYTVVAFGEREGRIWQTRWDEERCVSFTCDGFAHGASFSADGSLIVAVLPEGDAACVFGTQERARASQGSCIKKSISPSSATTGGAS